LAPADSHSPAESAKDGSVVPPARATALSPPSVVTDVQDRVLRVAARLFAQRGFHAVSIREIAAASEVSVSTVLYGGRTKQELLELILARSFSLQSAWVSALNQIDVSVLPDREACMATYDEIVRLAVQNTLDFPDTRRLWMRLRMDQPEVYETYYAKYTWPIFEQGMRLMRAAREQGVIDADDARLQEFISSIHWMLDGFFTSGIVDFAHGKTRLTTSSEAVSRFVEQLREYARRWFPPLA